MSSFLNGYKTYLGVIISVVTFVFGYFNLTIDPKSFVDSIYALLASLSVVVTTVGAIHKDIKAKQK
jgi:hypothetical protein